MAKRKKKRKPGNPARAAETRSPQREETRPALSRQAIAVGLVVLIVAGVAAFLLAGSGDDPQEEMAAAPEDLAVPWVDPQGQTPIVGAVDVNPADDSLWFSTNTGTWRVPAEGDQPTQVTGRLTTDAGSGDISEQLIVRFRGPNRLIGSGHPPAGSDLPPALGMIESNDGGETWTEISGAGQTDYHAIQLSGDAIVA